MSNYRLDIKGLITLVDYSNIYDCMELISGNDSLTITSRKENKEELEIVKSMIKHNNFLIDETIKGIEQEYFIRAYKDN